MKNKLTLSIRNLKCASCVKKIEDHLHQAPGVSSVNVNLADKSVTIQGQVSAKKMIQQLSLIGYEATESKLSHSHSADLFKNAMIAGSFGFTLLLLSLFNVLPGVQTIQDQVVWFVIGILCLITLTYTAGDIYYHAYKSFLFHQATMDTLIAIGTASAWLYSMLVCTLPQVLPLAGRHIYFEATLIIIAFVKFGAALESRARRHTSTSIQKLVNLTPKTATVIRDNKALSIAIDKIKPDDIVRVHPGEKIPVDGIVLEGKTTIDESMISGESLPVSKEVGSEVYAATLNQHGSLLIKTTQTGKHTLLGQIIESVEQAQNTKPPINRLVDQVAAIFVPTVMILAVCTALIWYHVGPEPKLAYMLVTAMTVLIIACPCALGLATPISIIVGVGKAAEVGILIRNGTALELASKLDMIIFDKTGTLTEGSPHVTQIISDDEDQLLLLASSVEAQSEHPLAQAVVNAAKDRNIKPLHCEHFMAETGLGAKGMVSQHKVRIGSHHYMQQHQISTEAFHQAAKQAASEGQTIIYCAVNDKLLGVLCISDPIKSDTPAAIAQCKKMGLKVAMLTGDNQATAAVIAKQCQLDEWAAELKPQEKLDWIKQKQQQYRLAMVGDGINDAPALTQADIGFAIGAGSDIAIESADVVLIRGSLFGVIHAIHISRATMQNIKQNLWGAFFYNILGLPIAAGVLYPLGFLLNPMIAGAAMALSSVTVVTNANRLRLRKFDD